MEPITIKKSISKAAKLVYRDGKKIVGKIQCNFLENGEPYFVTIYDGGASFYDTAKDAIKHLELAISLDYLVDKGIDVVYTPTN